MANENNKEFDRLFAIVDQGDINDATYPDIIKQLEELIAAGDVTRTLLLLPKQCLAYNFFDETQNAVANQFIIDALKLYPSMPEKIRIELKLCESTLIRYRGDIEAANKLIQQNLTDARTISDKRLMADAHSQLGQIASYTGDFAIALTHLLKSYELYQEFDLPTLQNLSLLDLAITYRRLGETDTALKYYTELEAKFTQRGQTALAMLVKNDMAYAYEDIEQYQKAADNYLSIYNYYLQVHTDPTFTARVAVDMSSALIELEQYQLALDYLNKHESVISPNVDTHYSFLQLSFARAKHGLGLTEQSLPHLEKATAGFEKNQNKRGKEMLLHLKVAIFESLQDWQLAYEAQLALYEIHLLLDKAMDNQASTEMRVKFDSEKIEAENAKLIAYQLLKEQQLQIKEDNKKLQMIALCLGLASILLLTLFSIRFNRKSAQLKQLALTDLLTQLPNRLHFYQQANRLFAKALKKQESLTVVSFDIDNFKQVNDNYGHDAGDKVLRAVANICQNNTRMTDVIGRVGGEEFLLLLPQTRSKAAISVTQYIIEQVSQYDFSDINDKLVVTISAGVCTLKDESTLPELIKKADTALYQAKNQGRNQLCYYHQAPQEL
ncbi:tetratricopeptide repeat-containing diguanylate cyclase [Shewanella donghaensis]|uniref:tetratricopeptide repeat-containing diguanylate cyclase n=1 Tax=Shewanella donghaensis TaxID=238836 RepID=UPI0013158374|nr:tetratricopeptide repeat-containing diguanylate cyclase [Shewanella donghaensis]